MGCYCSCLVLLLFKYVVVGRGVVVVVVDAMVVMDFLDSGEPCLGWEEPKMAILTRVVGTSGNLTFHRVYLIAARFFIQ